MRLETKYKMVMNFGNWRHEWSVVGGRGAISVWLNEGKEVYGGVEIHYRTPPKYMAEDAPSRIKCEFLGAPCWHDGSALAAESWISFWNSGRCDNKKMIKMVEEEYKRRFNAEDGDNE